MIVSSVAICHVFVKSACGYLSVSLRVAVQGKPAYGCVYVYARSKNASRKLMCLGKESSFLKENLEFGWKGNASSQFKRCDFLRGQSESDSQTSSAKRKQSLERRAGGSMYRPATKTCGGKNDETIIIFHPRRMVEAAAVGPSSISQGRVRLVAA